MNQRYSSNSMLSPRSTPKSIGRKDPQFSPRKKTLDDMIPSISSHRCSSSPRISKKSNKKHSKDLQSSNSANKNLRLFQERAENICIQLQQQARLDSLASIDLDTTDDFEFGECSPTEGAQEEEDTSDDDTSDDFEFGECSPTEGAQEEEKEEDTTDDFEFGECSPIEGAQEEEKEDDTTRQEDETFTPMIIDTGRSVEIEEYTTNYTCESSSSDPLLSVSNNRITEDNTMAFCPNRTPQRSSMKSPEGAKKSTSITPIDAIRETFEVVLPGRSQPIERQRSITFDDNIDIQNIEPVRLRAVGGLQSLWYQEKEYETIKFKTLALLDRVDHSSGIIDGKKYCTRGLEKFMTPEATEVKKHQAWDSVLNEQFLQRKDGDFDEDILANIYKYSTIRSKKEASKRAILDAAASEAYLQTTFPEHPSNGGLETQTTFNRRVSL